MPSVSFPTNDFSVFRTATTPGTRVYGYVERTADWSIPENTTLTRAYWSFSVRLDTEPYATCRAVGYEKGHQANEYSVSQNGEYQTNDVSVAGSFGSSSFFFGISVENTYTGTGDWEVEGTAFYRDVSFVVEYTPNTTACTPPETVLVSAEIVENKASLSWATARSGSDNYIVGYDIQYSDSSDGEDWGSWYSLESVDTDNTYGSIAITPPGTRGRYRRYRVRTRGSAGKNHYSEWSTATAVIRKNTLPTPVTDLVANKTTFDNGNISLSWSGSTDETGNVAGYRVGYITSTDGKNWSAQKVIHTVPTLSDTVTPSIPRGTYIRFVVNAVDSYGAKSADAFTQIIKRSENASVLAINWPADDSTTWTSRPSFGVFIPEDPDGMERKLQVKHGKSAWFDAGPVGKSAIDYVYKAAGALAAGTISIGFRIVDHTGKAGDPVYVSVVIGSISWARQIQSGTIICSLDENGETEISHIADIREMVEKTNERRRWHGLTDFDLETEIGYFSNWLPQMVEIYNAISECYTAKNETAPSFPNQSGNAPTAATINAIRSMIERA